MKESPLSAPADICIAAKDGKLKVLRVPVSPSPRLGCHWKNGIFIPADSVQIPLTANPFGGVDDRIWLREKWRAVGVPFAISDSQCQIHIEYYVDQQVAVYTVGREYGNMITETKRTWQRAISLPFGFSRSVLVIDSVAIEPAARISTGQYRPTDWVFGVHTLGFARPIPHARIGESALISSEGSQRREFSF